MLYISTSVWVLHTPNFWTNMLFHVFHSDLAHLNGLSQGIQPHCFLPSLCYHVALLCILTSEWVLRLSFTAQTHLFLHLNKFFHLFPSQMEKKKMGVFLVIFPINFYSFFSFAMEKDGKTCFNTEKNYFDQLTVFGAPICWSKYTTGLVRNLYH